MACMRMKMMIILGTALMAIRKHLSLEKEYLSEENLPEAGHMITIVWFASTAIFFAI
jgi:hypothetical protein